MRLFNTNGPLYSQGYERNSFLGAAIPNAFRSEPHASNDIDASHFPPHNSPSHSSSFSRRSGITGGGGGSHNNQINHSVSRRASGSTRSNIGSASGSTGSGFGFHLPSSQESTTTCSSSSVYQLPSTDVGRREEWTERETNSLYGNDIDRPGRNGHDVVNVNLDGSLSLSSSTTKRTSSTLDCSLAHQINSHTDMMTTRNVLRSVGGRLNHHGNTGRMGSFDALSAAPPLIAANACSSNESRSPCSRRTRSRSPRSRSRSRRNRALCSGMRLDERSGQLTLDEQWDDEQGLWDALDLEDYQSRGRGHGHYQANGGGGGGLFLQSTPHHERRRTRQTRAPPPQSAAELLLRGAHHHHHHRVAANENVIPHHTIRMRRQGLAVSHHNTSLIVPTSDIQRPRLGRETLMQIRMHKKRSSSLPPLRAL